MNLTKLDVLSEQDEILVGVHYRAKDGTILSSVPADLDILEGVTVSVLYHELRGSSPYLSFLLYSRRLLCLGESKS